MKLVFPKPRVLIRGLSLWVAMSFILPTLSWAFEPGSYVSGPGTVRLNQQTYTLPGEYGQIDESYQGGDRTIVCIQDLHCHYEVQKNIGRVIDYFVRRHGLRLVGEEGAWGPVDLSVLREFPDAGIREMVGDFYVQQGKVTGAEYYAATSRHSVSLEGIENPQAYQASQAALQGFLNAESQGYCYDLRDQLEECKPLVYNPALRQWDTQHVAYREGRLDLLHYVLALKKAAHRHRVALADFREIEKYAIAKTRAAEINPERLYQELDAADRRLRESLYSTPSQRELDQWAHRLDIIEKLINISVTPDELAEFRGHPDRFSLKAFQAFYQQQAGQPGDVEFEMAQMDHYLKQAEAFYRLADQRSVQFVDTLLARMDQTREKTALMVNGGFHSQHVADELKRRGISYLLVRPALTKLDMVNPYHALLQGRKLPLEKFLEKNQNIMAVRSAFQGLGFIRLMAQEVGALGLTRIRNLAGYLNRYPGLVLTRLQGPAGQTLIEVTNNGQKSYWLIVKSGLNKAVRKVTGPLVVADVIGPVVRVVAATQEAMAQVQARLQAEQEVWRSSFQGLTSVRFVLDLLSAPRLKVWWDSLVQIARNFSWESPIQFLDTGTGIKIPMLGWPIHYEANLQAVRGNKPGASLQPSQDPVKMNRITLEQAREQKLITTWDDLEKFIEIKITEGARVSIRGGLPADNIIEKIIEFRGRFSNEKLLEIVQLVPRGEKTSLAGLRDLVIEMARNEQWTKINNWEGLEAYVRKVVGVEGGKIEGVSIDDVLKIIAQYKLLWGKIEYTIPKFRGTALKGFEEKLFQLTSRDFWSEKGDFGEINTIKELLQRLALAFSVTGSQAIEKYEENTIWQMIGEVANTFETTGNLSEASKTFPAFQNLLLVGLPEAVVRVILHDYWATVTTWAELDTKIKKAADQEGKIGEYTVDQVLAQVKKVRDGFAKNGRVQANLITEGKDTKVEGLRGKVVEMLVAESNQKFPQTGLASPEADGKISISAKPNRNFSQEWKKVYQFVGEAVDYADGLIQDKSAEEIIAEIEKYRRREKWSLPDFTGTSLAILPSHVMDMVREEEWEKLDSVEAMEDYQNELQQYVTAMVEINGGYIGGLTATQIMAQVNRFLIYQGEIGLDMSLQGTALEGLDEQLFKRLSREVWVGVDDWEKLGKKIDEIYLKRNESPNKPEKIKEDIVRFYEEFKKTGLTVSATQIIGEFQSRDLAGLPAAVVRIVLRERWAKIENDINVLLAEIDKVADQAGRIGSESAESVKDSVKNVFAEFADNKDWNVVFGITRGIGTRVEGLREKVIQMLEEKYGTKYDLIATGGVETVRVAATGTMPWLEAWVMSTFGVSSRTYARWVAPALEFAPLVLLYLARGLSGFGWELSQSEVAWAFNSYAALFYLAHGLKGQNSVPNDVFKARLQTAGRLSLFNSAFLIMVFNAVQILHLSPVFTAIVLSLMWLASHAITNIVATSNEQPTNQNRSESAPLTLGAWWATVMSWAKNVEWQLPVQWADSGMGMQFPVIGSPFYAATKQSVATEEDNLKKFLSKKPWDKLSEGEVVDWEKQWQLMSYFITRALGDREIERHTANEINTQIVRYRIGQPMFLPSFDGTFLQGLKAYVIDMVRQQRWQEIDEQESAAEKWELLKRYVQDVLVSEGGSSDSLEASLYIGYIDQYRITKGDRNFLPQVLPRGLEGLEQKMVEMVSQELWNGINTWNEIFNQLRTFFDEKNGRIEGLTAEELIEKIQNFRKAVYITKQTAAFMLFPKFKTPRLAALPSKIKTMALNDRWNKVKTVAELTQEVKNSAINGFIGDTPVSSVIYYILMAKTEYERNNDLRYVEFITRGFNTRVEGLRGIVIKLLLASKPENARTKSPSNIIIEELADLPTVRVGTGTMPWLEAWVMSTFKVSSRTYARWVAPALEFSPLVLLYLARGLSGFGWELSQSEVALFFSVFPNFFYFGHWLRGRSDISEEVFRARQKTAGRLALFNFAFLIAVYSIIQVLHFTPAFTAVILSLMWLVSHTLTNRSITSSRPSQRLGDYVGQAPVGSTRLSDHVLGKSILENVTGVFGKKFNLEHGILVRKGWSFSVEYSSEGQGLQGFAAQEYLQQATFILTLPFYLDWLFRQRMDDPGVKGTIIKYLGKMAGRIVSARLKAYAEETRVMSQKIFSPKDKAAYELNYGAASSRKTWAQWKDGTGQDEQQFIYGQIRSEALGVTGTEVAKLIEAIRMQAGSQSRSLWQAIEPELRKLVDLAGEPPSTWQLILALQNVKTNDLPEDLKFLVFGLQEQIRALDQADDPMRVQVERNHLADLIIRSRNQQKNLGTEIAQAEALLAEEGLDHQVSWLMDKAMRENLVGVVKQIKEQNLDPALTGMLTTLEAVLDKPVLNAQESAQVKAWLDAWAQQGSVSALPIGEEAGMFSYAGSVSTGRADVITLAQGKNNSVWLVQPVIGQLIARKREMIEDLNQNTQPAEEMVILPYTGQAQAKFNSAVGNFTRDMVSHLNSSQLLAPQLKELGSVAQSYYAWFEKKTSLNQRRVAQGLLRQMSHRARLLQAKDPGVNHGEYRSALRALNMLWQGSPVFERKVQTIGMLDGNPIYAPSVLSKGETLRLIWLWSHVDGFVPSQQIEDEVNQERLRHFRIDSAA